MSHNKSIIDFKSCKMSMIFCRFKRFRGHQSPDRLLSNPHLLLTGEGNGPYIPETEEHSRIKKDIISFFFVSMNSASTSEPPTANIKPTPVTGAPGKPSPIAGSKSTPRASIRPMVTPAPMTTPTATVMPTTVETQEGMTRG